MSETKRPLKVFLCHASIDKPRVRELYRYLRKRGVRPWFDEEALVGGQDWQVEIPKAIACSDAIIICLTKNSEDKQGFMQKEIKFALDKALEMPEGQVFLIPVRFEECGVPFLLSRYQWVDLFDEAGYLRMMKALKFRALHLDRVTVELPKTTAAVAEKNLALEKVVREEAEHESAEKAKREKAEHEAAEKAKREKAEHEAAEKAKREKVERESVEKTMQEKAGREAAGKSTQEKAEHETINANPVSVNPNITQKPTGPKSDGNAAQLPTFIFGTIGTLGMIAICIVGIIVFSIMNTPRSNSVPTNTAPVSNTSVPTNRAPVSNTSVPTNRAPVSNSSVPTNTAPPSNTTSLTEITDAKNVSMVLVPAGEFTMASAANSSDSAQTIYLDAFYIDKYEVTNALYKTCFDAGGCPQKPQDYNSNTRSDYYGNPVFNNYPVLYVDWYMANIYCEWRDARLPTESEWEKAARGTDGRSFPWGENWNDNANSYKGNFGDTTVVGSYENGKSPFGVYDMAGNVWEWVSSLYKSYPYSPTDGREKLDVSGMRVLRGGSWKSMGIEIQTNYRYRLDPRSTESDIGFRCAKSAP